MIQSALTRRDAAFTPIPRAKRRSYAAEEFARKCKSLGNDKH
jgi:hypothetical protein